MAYRDWDEGFQEVFDETPGISHAEQWEIEYLEELFEAGFTHHSDEAGYDSAEAEQAREDFFEFLGLDESDFPWDDWREAMGYE